jgi:hypothetical protein
MTSTVGSRSCRTDGGDTTGFRALTLSATRQGAYRGASTFDVTIAAQRAAPSRVSVDGRAVQAGYDAAARTVRFTVPASASRMELVH